jgi:hypothetical protein
VLRRYPRRKASIRLYVTHAEEEYSVLPLTAGTWCIETASNEPPCPPYPIVFTDRAQALIASLGCKLDGIECAARLALKSAFPEDYGFCDFSRAHRGGRLEGCLTDDDRAEIDLDDWWREILGA